jgi:hypothetical protein
MYPGAVDPAADHHVVGTGLGARPAAAAEHPQAECPDGRLDDGPPIEAHRPAA